MRRHELARARSACPEVTTFADLAERVMPHVGAAFDCALWNLTRVHGDGRFELVRSSALPLNHEYMTTWFSRDPLNRILLRRPADRVLPISRLPEWPRLARHPVYSEFCPARGVRHFFFLQLSAAGYLRPGATTVVLARGPEQRDFEPDDAVALAQLLPELQAAERRCARAGAAEALVPLLEAALAGVGPGARLILDGAGRVAWMSAEARALLGAGRLPAFVPGQLVLARGQRVRVRSTPLAARSLLVELVPEGESGLARRFGLTRAEAEVLADLGAGLTNAEIARRRGVAVNTVRNQVASVLDKLGVRTRVEAGILAARG